MGAVGSEPTGGRARLPQGTLGGRAAQRLGGWAWVSAVFAVNRSPSAHSPGLVRAGGLQREWPPPLPTPLTRLMKGLGPEGLRRQLRGKTDTESPASPDEVEEVVLFESKN